MKKLFIILGALVFASVALVPTGSALAAEITFVSVGGFWRDPVDSVPGSQPGDPAITNGDPISSVVWGTTTGSQSGYDFTATLPPPFTLPGPVPFFSLGSFTHRNFEVDEPWLVSAELDVVLVIAVDGVPINPLNFTFTINHEETPNNQTPCPYPTPPGEGCTDRVTIVASPAPTTFNVDGVDYTLAMSFLDNGSPVDEFITREGGTVNSSGLVGDFTLPPGLTVAKTGPATMRLVEWGDFVIGVHNASESDAHNVTLVDRLPDGPTGGMCDTTPEILSARVFAADGVTPVPGKGPLVQGTDYSLAYNSAACELTFNTLTAASMIGVDERLMITYRTQLDTDSQDGVTLTNVAGATQWFNADGSTLYSRTLTDGTVGVGDHEDAHSVTVDQPVLRFEKTVMNVTTGEDPGTVATPGETLRYRLTVVNESDVAVDDFSIRDELDRLNDPPAFQPGTLRLTSVPPSPATNNSSDTGGSSGTGLLDIGNLNLGGLGDSVEIEFDVVLAPVIANGSFVTNQSQMLTDGFVVELSDDPNIGDPPDPNVFGDEDPTRVLIESAPVFRVEKISTDVSGDPSVLLAGETLRYTMTIENIGNDDAVDATLRDAVPVNTTYVAGSTTLNGAAVPDGAGGTAPLSTGKAIYAPSNPTPGVMRADGVSGTDVATLVFDVVIDPGVVDGTVISNQAFVSAVLGGVGDQPSDDPSTSVPDDPTRNVVGSVPLLFASKSVEIGVDGDSLGIVDPLDELHYTIVVSNTGAVPATDVTLTDTVPTGTSWLMNSLLLNGEPVGVPDGGVSPLIAGIGIASSDVPLPLPGPSGGIINPGESAVIEFDLLVGEFTARGTLISNQAVVGGAGLPNLLTDGDGNPATGPEPTVVVVGDGQQLLITKQVLVGGGAALAGGQLEYEVRVTNVAAVAAQSVLISDDLAAPVANQLSPVAGSATLDGLPAGVGFSGQVLMADYFGIYGPLPPGASTVVRFRRKPRAPASRSMSAECRASAP